MNNNTDIEFQVLSNGERYAWATYNLFILVSSIIGDILILIASLNKETFKINQLLVTIIQHIAVADLGVALFDVLPGLISLIANSWILGESFCTAAAYVVHYVNTASILTILLLTASKFILLKYPLRSGNFSKNTGHLVSSLTWIFCFTIPVLMYTLQRGGDKVSFDTRIYNCNYIFKSNIWATILPITSTLFLLLPNVTIILLSIPLLRYIVEARNSARRVRGNIPWQGALTVGLTALVYTISNLPFFIFAVAAKFLQDYDLVWFHLHLYRVAHSLLYFNVVSNFYIYFLTIKSFRRFVLSGGSSVVQGP